MIEPGEMGVDALVALIRRRPRVDESAPPDDHALGFALRGPAVAGLAAAEQLCRQAAALKAACVAAIADETPWGASGDQVLDEVSCELVVSCRSALARGHGRDPAPPTRCLGCAESRRDRRHACPDPCRCPVRGGPAPTPTGSNSMGIRSSVGRCSPRGWPTPRITPPAGWNCSYGAAWPSSAARTRPDAGRAPGRTWDPSHDATRRPEPLDLWLAAALVDLSAA